MNTTIRRLASDVYKILGFSFDVDIFDKDGNRVYDASAARNFYVKPGKIMIVLMQKNDRHELTVNLSKHIPIDEFEKKIGQKLRGIVAKNGNVKYNIRTYGKEIVPKDFAEQISSNGESNMTSQDIHEGMYGTTRSSYQKVGECKVIIRHEGRVNEEKFGARSRYISAIFVETRAGERFKLAENNLHAARALAMHLSNGGSPIDTVGVKITEMMKEMAELKIMIKETKSHIKESSEPEKAIALQEQIKTRFISLRETLKRMGGSYGYKGMVSTINENEKLTEYQPAGQFQALDNVAAWDDKNEWFDAVMTYIKRKLKSNQIRKADKQITKADALAMLNLSDEDKNLFLELARKQSISGNGMAEASKASKKQLAFVPTFPDKFSELVWKMGDAVSSPARYNEDLIDYFKNDENFNEWTRTVERLNDQMRPFSTKLTSEEKEYLNNTVIPMLQLNIQESITEEKKTVKTKERSVEKDAGDQVQDMIDFARDKEVSSDDLFSVNEELKENTILEAWFNNISNVEFFNEEDLTFSEDVIPVTEVELGHRIDEFHKGSELSDAFSMMDDYMSQLRMSSDEAIEKAARYYTDEYHNGDEQAFEQARESLKQMAQGAGLINHDVGRTFADDVLSKDEEIRKNKEEIRSEEFYGDARFEENDVYEESKGCKDEEQLNAEASGPYIGEEHPIARSNRERSEYISSLPNGAEDFFGQAAPEFEDYAHSYKKELDAYVDGETDEPPEEVDDMKLDSLQSADAEFHKTHDTENMDANEVYRAWLRTKGFGTQSVEHNMAKNESNDDYDDYDDDEYEDKYQQKKRDMERKGRRQQRDDKRFSHMDEKTKHDLGDEINAKKLARIIELAKYRT